MSTPREINVVNARAYPSGLLFQLTGQGQSFGWYWLASDGDMWAWLQGVNGAGHWGRHTPTSLIPRHSLGWFYGERDEDDRPYYKLELANGPVAFVYPGRSPSATGSPERVSLGYPYQNQYGGTQYRWTTDPVMLQFDQHGNVWGVRHDPWNPEVVYVTDRQRRERDERRARDRARTRRR